MNPHRPDVSHAGTSQHGGRSLPCTPSTGAFRPLAHCHHKLYTQQTYASDEFGPSCWQTQLEVEAETARVAAVQAEGLVVRLNSLARLLDALAAQEAKIQEWWQDVRL